MRLGQLYHDWTMIVKLWNELLGDVMEADNLQRLKSKFKLCSAAQWQLIKNLNFYFYFDFILLSKEFFT